MFIQPSPNRSPGQIVYQKQAQRGVNIPADAGIIFAWILSKSRICIGQRDWDYQTLVDKKIYESGIEYARGVRFGIVCSL